MPIDIRLLRNSEDAKQVEQWQLLRGGRTAAPTKVNEIIQLDKELRQSQKILNGYKSSCRQECKRPDAELLKSYQNTCNVNSSKLQKGVCTLANRVDETALSSMPKWQQSDEAKINRNNKSNNLGKSSYRTLIELGAWEIIGNSNNNDGKVLLCWTGLGIKWGNALSNFLEKSMMVHENAYQSPSQEERQQILHLPACFEMQQNDLHAMMGYSLSSSSQNSCCEQEEETPSTTSAPSWLGYLKLQYSDQTLGDKQLPKVVQYSVQRRCRQDDIISDLDVRERLREESLMLPTAAASCIESTVHHVLILTSATYYDSRKAQQEWIDRLIEFYRSLLVPTIINDDDENDNDKDNDKFVRKRAVSPPDLLAAEVSRVVVEGFVPPISTTTATGNGGGGEGKPRGDNGGGHWMILAYLSNFSDFPTRACRIKNNNNQQQQQFCHVLQGTLLSIPETMCWQASINNGHNDGSLALPHDMVENYFPAGGEATVMLPQVKKLETTKNGRLHLQKIAPPTTANHLTTSKTTKVLKKPTLVGKPNPSRSVEKNKTNLQAKSSIPVLELNTKATTEQIKGEALSTPFSFLPFYDHHHSSS